MKELEIKIKLIRKDNGDIDRHLLIPASEDFSYLEVIGAIQLSICNVQTAYEKQNETTNTTN